ncbi:MAG: M15 family metallopeptidase [Nitrospirae bacterium]|nr:M15 family metallopeptidase [Nitrospirota bacterium]MBI3604398.1 M15 family metallopeptidase [Nitrospirota bacterium]
MEVLSLSREFVEILPSKEMAIDLRYASLNNFTGQNLYGDFKKAYLHRIAAEKLAKAAAILQTLRPGRQMVIYDALRPRSAQQILWNHVKGTSKEHYVANPQGGSMHNFGFAVDLSLYDASGKELDMGTLFDEFTPMSQPRLEDQFLKEGKLSEAQIQNRHLLRKAMEEAGFIQLPIEWWHFDALPKSEVKASYKIIE